MTKAPPTAAPPASAAKKAARAAATLRPKTVEQRDGDDGAISDFRTRVGAEKRERTRERLLSATFEAYAGSAPGTRPVIDDVIRVAGVSRGTFYKYFESLDEILPELGQRMAQEMVATYEQLFGAVADPAVRTAGGPLLTLSRAAMEPARVAFTSRVDLVQYLNHDALHGMEIKACLLQAREAGVLSFESLDAAIDFSVGAALEGTRRILHAPGLDPAYSHQLTVMILRGLGMAPTAADQAAAQAWQVLTSRSAELAWWRPGKLINASAPIPTIARRPA
jgi:AcrR family transcriptional regulator